jgi:complement component 1 Q subcomponent-binding protein, mitochondrial
METNPLRVATAVKPASNKFFSSSANTLADMLAKELAEESEEGSTEMPEDLAELKSTIEKDWKIVDDGATTRLFRSIGSTKVVVSFHCQDTVEGVEDSQADEDGEEPAMPFRFEILVSKAGNTLVLGCISSGGTATVDGVAMTTEDIESVQANGIGRNNYQGPEFPELAEGLQDAFHEYVFSELGVNDDVSAFISMYADYQEQKQYVGFLRSVAKVLP